MEQVRLGKSNLKVSKLWLGGMSFGNPAERAWVRDEADSRAIIFKAVELGISVIDSCDVYCKGASEEIIGRAVREMGNRHELVLATKAGFKFGKGPNEGGYSRKHLIEACENALRRLGTDYIDLFQTHIWDPVCDVDEMVAAFDRLVSDGKVLYAGAADMPAWQFAKAIYGARARQQASFVSMQFHYNPIWREAERELIPLCAAEGIGIVPYSPLGRGFLCGEPRTTLRARTDDRIGRWYDRPEDQAVAHVISGIAKDIGRPTASVPLAWVLGRPGVDATVVGPTSPQQLEELVANLDLELSGAQSKAIDDAYAHRGFGGHGG